MRTLSVTFGLLLLATLLGAPGMTDAGDRTYRCEKEDGSVEYSNRPCEGGEEVTLPQITTYEGKRQPAADTTEGEGEDGGEKEADGDRKKRGDYFTIHFLDVEEDQVFHNIGATLSVSLSVSPAMGEGQGVMLYFDGEPVTQSPTTSMSFQLEEVWRGTHTLKAEVVDRGGKVLSTDSVSFHVRQHSVANPP